MGKDGWQNKYNKPKINEQSDESNGKTKMEGMKWGRLHLDNQENK